MDIPFFSVIIPVYNSEKTIERTLKSILPENQSGVNIQVVICDDGSTDSSEEICNNYSKRFLYFDYYKLPHGGVSIARNFGLSKVIGKHVLFLDSDDEFESGFLKNIIDYDDDFILFNVKNVLVYSKNDEEILTSYLEPNKSICSSEFLPDMRNRLIDGDYSCLRSLVNKAFKTEIINKYNLRFSEDLVMGEDFCFCIRFISHCKTLIYRNVLGYVYYIAGGTYYAKYGPKAISSTAIEYEETNVFLNNIFPLSNVEKDVFYYNFIKRLLQVSFARARLSNLELVEVKRAFDCNFTKNAILHLCNNGKFSVAETNSMLLAYCGDYKRAYNEYREKDAGIISKYAVKKFNNINKKTLFNLDKISILVNTCDKYEEVWKPFFYFFNKNWRNCKYPVYLNTETKKCNVDNIITLNAGKDLSWSERLKKTLRSINSKYVIIFLEDFFLLDKVNQDEIDRCIDIMEKDKKISVIDFEYVARIKSNRSEYEGYSYRDFTAMYFLNCQTSIWRRKDLIKFLSPYENPWQFEFFGSNRAKLYNKKFLMQADDRTIFSYNVNWDVGYGLCKGRWLKSDVKLFEDNGISVDFSNLGFYESGSVNNGICQPPKKCFKDRYIYLLYGGDSLERTTVKMMTKTLFKTPKKFFKIWLNKLGFFFTNKR